MFFFIFFAAAQWYVARVCKRWIEQNYTPEQAGFIRKTGIICIILANLVFCSRFLTTELRLYDHFLVQSAIIYPGGILLAALGIFLTLILTVDAVRFLKWTSGKIAGFRSSLKIDRKISQKNACNKGRREFIKKTSLALAATPFGIAIGTAAATAHDYQIIRKELFFDHLPPGLDGLKIAQISDIHSGIYMTQRQINEIFEITNSLHPNLVTITGDFVDTSVNEIPALYNTVQTLKSDFGTFGCLGNHDHYASGPAVSSALEQRGVEMLVNNNSSLRINGEDLTMIGVDDAGSGRHNHARFDNALHNVDQDTFKILLSHRPELFDLARQQNIDLTLSGHTHGGQIGMDVFGIPLYPVKLLYNYTNGLYEQGKEKLYVNVGVGMVGVPIRLVRPEISLLTLKVKP